MPAVAPEDDVSAICESMQTGDDSSVTRAVAQLLLSPQLPHVRSTTSTHAFRVRVHADDRGMHAPSPPCLIFALGVALHVIETPTWRDATSATFSLFVKTPHLSQLST